MLQRKFSQQRQQQSLVLGACADVASAFGKLPTGSVTVDQQSAGGSGCYCENIWYCQVTGRHSLSEPLVSSYQKGPLATYINYCWNTCYKNPGYFAGVEDDWKGSNCKACQGDGISEGTYGCECKTEATYFTECNVKADDGFSPAEMYAKKMCSPFTSPGGSLMKSTSKERVDQGLGDGSFEDILTARDVDVPYNPVRHASDWATTYGQESSPFFDGLTFCGLESTIGAQDAGMLGNQTTVCAGILSDGSVNVGSASGCATKSTDCNKAYYYTANTIGYCKDDYISFDYVNDKTQQWGCSAWTSRDECGGRYPKSHKRISLNPWGKYLACEWKGNKCAAVWTNSATFPTRTKTWVACTPDNPPWVADSNICKEALCGAGVITGVRPDDPACSLR